MFFKAWKTGKSHVLCDSVFHISFWGALVSFDIDFLVFHSQFFLLKEVPQINFKYTCVLCFLPSLLLRCFLLVCANQEHLWWANFFWKTLFSSMVSAARWPKFCLYINSLSVYQANRNHTVNECNFKACVWSVKQYRLMSQ